MILLLLAVACIPLLALRGTGGGLSVAVTISPSAPAAEAPSHGDALLSAIEWVESRGNPDAVGMLDELGILQISPIMVLEVNRILGEDKYTLGDRRDIAKSREMFWVYSRYWADKLDDFTDEGIARRWNGGPDGHKENATLIYWHAVSARLRTVSAD